ATTREVLTGHEHREEELIQTTKDEKGSVLRRMPTRNKIDDRHHSMGYTTAHKRSKIFEDSEDDLLSIQQVEEGRCYVVINWEEIRKEYESSDITLKALAEKYGLKDPTIRSRKSREKWQRNATSKNATQRKNVATKKPQNKTESRN